MYLELVSMAERVAVLLEGMLSPDYKLATVTPGLASDDFVVPLQNSFEAPLRTYQLEEVAKMLAFMIKDKVGKDHTILFVVPKGRENIIGEFYVTEASKGIKATVTHGGPNGKPKVLFSATIAALVHDENLEPVHEG